jgi:hypothetical protein
MKVHQDSVEDRSTIENQETCCPIVACHFSINLWSCLCCDHVLCMANSHNTLQNEPIQVISYPSELDLPPGETKQFDVTVENRGSVSYSVILSIFVSATRLFKMVILPSAMTLTLSVRDSKSFRVVCQ